MSTRSKTSPSLTYVAICIKTNFDGYYFRKFTLPEKGRCNNAEFAAWYFLDVLDSTACIDKCITFEDYSDIESAWPIPRLSISHN